MYYQFILSRCSSGLVHGGGRGGNSSRSSSSSSSSSSDILSNSCAEKGKKLQLTNPETLVVLCCVDIAAQQRLSTATSVNCVAAIV